MEKVLNFIGGDLVEPATGYFLENIEPATNTALNLIPRSGKQDVEKAVKAALQAFPVWSKFTREQRSYVLLNIAEFIEGNLDELAEIEAKDTGKPIKIARTVDIPRAIHNFRFFATAILHESSESHTNPQGVLNYSLRQPLGIVGCISPWNLPLYLFSWKIAPALAAGNAVIGKPSELAPTTAFELAKICQKANLPTGVLNILHGLGPEVGLPIVEHPEVKAISFTGGTNTGKTISLAAAPMFKKLSLEMGGKNPNIVFADCDLEMAVSTTVKSSFLNQGQICLCGSRILLQDSIYEEFKRKFVKATEQLVKGDPMESDVNFGALVSKSHFEKVKGYISLAEEEGGKIILGGNSFIPNDRCKNGFFIEPTIIENLDAHCRVNQEEIFGPVVSLIPFEDVEDAIKIANATPYGLSASIWTSNLKNATRLAAEIQSGVIWINSWLLRDLRTPFGGMKQSGVGREGGWEALRFFQETKNICIQT